MGQRGHKGSRVLRIGTREATRLDQRHSQQGEKFSITAGTVKDNRDWMHLRESPLLAPQC
jgi:hypothetical protein